MAAWGYWLTPSPTYSTTTLDVEDEEYVMYSFGDCLEVVVVHYDGALDYVSFEQ